MRLSMIVYTLFSRFLLIVISCILAIPAAFLIFIVPQRYRYNRLYFWFSWVMYYLIIKISLLPITIKGKENLPKEPAIYVANHSSSLDIPMLGVLLNGKPHVWFAMKWLTHFWFFRLLLPRVAVLVDMDNPHNNVRSLIRTIQMVKRHSMSIMIFPEGARFVDDQIHSFYGGFVLLARKIGLPIVPVRLFNLEKVYPPNTFWVHYYPVHIVIGKPMHVQESETDEQCKERVYQWFINVEVENVSDSVRPE